MRPGEAAEVMARLQPIRDHELEHLGPWGCVAKASSSFDSFLRSLKPLEDEQ